MNLFEILGPVMVGPSSSHTAGAVRIGYVARKLLGEAPASIQIRLHGSFAATGRGHGTDCALVAGLLGMRSDDLRIPDSLRLAAEQGVLVEFGSVHLKNAHPNTACLDIVGCNGNRVSMTASSLGGGRIQVTRLDGIRTAFSGESPTLIVQHQDQPGYVAGITSLLAEKSVNIATLNLYRDSRGGRAVMVVETDQPIPPDVLRRVSDLDGILKTAYVNIGEEES